MFKKIVNLFYSSSIFLLMFFSSLLVITSIGWICKSPLTIFQPLISFIISCVLFYLLREKDKLKLFYSVLISIIVCIIAILISCHFYDQSDDGNSYHKETIGMISRGWNPIWDDYDKFAEDNKLSREHSMWASHYPKTTWIIGSTFYIITGNIESAKCFNIVICYISFFIFLKFLIDFILNKIIALLISIIVVLNPIMMSQIFSLYLDGFLGLLLLIIILMMYKYTKDNRNMDVYIILCSTMILIINCKFTGFAYAGLFCLGFYTYYLYKRIKEKNIQDMIKSIVFFGCVVTISVVLVGSSSYVKNTMDHKNPFYPLMGKGKVDIMTYLQPKSFQKMSPIEKNYYSIFSKSANIGVFNNGEPVLKIPFTYDNYEVSQITYDTRIGGNGVLFSGIFIISIIIILLKIVLLIKEKDIDNLILLLIPIFIITLLLLFLSDGWWARYSPYLYLIIIISILILSCNKKKLVRLFLLIFCFIILSNSYLNFKSYVEKDVALSGYSREKLKELANSEIDICLQNHRFSGILYNLDDYDIEYNIVDCNDSMNKLYSNFIFYNDIKYH